MLDDGPLPSAAPPVAPAAPIVLGDVEVRPDECEVLVAGRRVGLTVREFQIFQVLARAPRDRSVDVFVRKVRLKLAVVSPDVTFIPTHFGIGYRLAPQPSSC